ncbi:hypothetical protein [Amycolatopsis sp. CA-230715]|uniref:hypothetical protein n=1 Tax=Amycolatopsis sp. CA-230715 TaxID=2745196 RepID=UPI001C01F714|nr:hypothetical protein HUW46_02088 [Amycolatopsis sp. CA-230715]
MRKRNVFLRDTRKFKKGKRNLTIHASNDEFFAEHEKPVPACAGMAMEAEAKFGGIGKWSTYGFTDEPVTCKKCKAKGFE